MVTCLVKDPLEPVTNTSAGYLHVDTGGKQDVDV
jgi:hypothetical protein